MKKIISIVVLSTALAGGAFLGMKDYCKPVCDTELWQSTVVIDKIYVDFNGDGHFDKSELRTNYRISRNELALITFKEYGSRYLWIYPPGNSKPKYQIKGRDVGLGKFTRLYLPQELQKCCYLEKGASRRKNGRQKPGNDPQSQKSLLRFDIIRKANINSSGELEVVTSNLGGFVIQKDRARVEKGRITQYNLCSCDR